MLSFTNPKHDRISHLSTQMKFRLREGNGEAFYYIGVKDDGYPQGINYQYMVESIKVIYKMANNTKSEAIIMKWMKGYNGRIVKMYIRQKIKDSIIIDIRI